ncbi:MAG: FkbM family methyltransferase [Gemmatimonadota bacterium]|nr:FkbM family methyltransferase [Gemmatimonadota bacterium]
MQLPYALRTLGQRLFRHVPVRVRSGVNRGRRWSLVTTGRGYGSGRFGRARVEVLEALLQPGECFLDLGAHKGFMSLAASRLVGPAGTVIAVEPATTNLWFLERHLRWNHANNVQIVRAAVGADSRTVKFGGQGDSLAYEVGTGDEDVPLRPVDRLLHEYGLPRPTAIKMDIEGRELDALQGGRTLLRPDVFLLISVHTRELYDRCQKLLEDAGFRLFPSHEIALRLSGVEPEWGGDHDLLAVGAERAVDASKLGELNLFRGS